MKRYLDSLEFTIFPEKEFFAAKLVFFNHLQSYWFSAKFLSFENNQIYVLCIPSQCWREHGFDKFGQTHKLVFEN